jgi:hypothetical protein
MRGDPWAACCAHSLRYALPSTPSSHPPPPPARAFPPQDFVERAEKKQSFRTQQIQLHIKQKEDRIRAMEEARKLQLQQQKRKLQRELFTRQKILEAKPGASTPDVVEKKLVTLLGPGAGAKVRARVCFREARPALARYGRRGGGYVLSSCFLRSLAPPHTPNPNKQTTVLGHHVFFLTPCHPNARACKSTCADTACVCCVPVSLLCCAADAGPGHRPPPQVRVRGVGAAVCFPRVLHVLWTVDAAAAL